VKNLISLEKSLYKDILITLLIVLVSIPVWLNLDMSAYAMEADAYNNYNYVKYEFLNKVSSSLMTYEDSDALRECETTDILVYNDSNTLDSYSLVLKINKDNDVNLDAIRINVNYDIMNLNEYEFFEDAKCYYYVIDSDDIAASSQKYIVSLWNSDITSANNQYFDYEFVIL